MPKADIRSDNAVITENSSIVWEAGTNGGDAGRITDSENYVVIEVGSGTFRFVYTRKE